LGENSLIASFPVGRRVAFDPARGRLWAVCPRCARWSLSPIEERWEALEECERLFSRTPLRVSTDNIGLARTREGMDLVRVGKPNRPEFAAWRYSGQFSGRRMRFLRNAAAVVGLGVPVTLGAVALAGPGALLVPVLVGGAHRFYRRTKDKSHVTAVPVADGRWLHVRRHDLPDARLIPSYTRRSYELRLIAAAERHDLRGEDAVRAGQMLLPAFNVSGGAGRDLQHALEFLHDHPTPEDVFYGAAKLRGHSRSLALEALPRPVRLAMEMAANDHTERDLTDLDLALLERAWEEAERIAEIADNLLLPRGVEAALRRLQIERVPEPE
jgi:hypothetical protein